MTLLLLILQRGNCRGNVLKFQLISMWITGDPHTSGNKNTKRALTHHQYQNMIHKLYIFLKEHTPTSIMGDGQPIIVEAMGVDCTT